MELDAATLGTLIGAVVLALGGREGVAQLRRSRGSSSAGDSLGPGQSRVSKADVKELVAHAEAEATWRAEVRGKLDGILAEQKQHAEYDKERFERHDEEIERQRTKSHDLSSDVQRHGIQLDEVRRELGLITDPGRPSPVARPARRAR